jgi:hypothetical protein
MSLSGSSIALFFQARALLINASSSMPQAQLGLQFVTAALASHPRNPGMHHTKALLLECISCLTRNESAGVSHAALEDALHNIETALVWDAKSPHLYVTRARVKYRLNDQLGAVADIRVGIELARYRRSSPLISHALAEWKQQLDQWQLTSMASTAEDRHEQIGTTG